MVRIARQVYDDALTIAVDEFVVFAPSLTTFATVMLQAIQEDNARVLEGQTKLADTGARIERKIDRISTSDVTVGDISAYLKSRIADWDTPEWGGKIPSVMKRRLKTHVQRKDEAPQELTEQEAISGQPTLIVLGGPGSGKTWLAYRYAREAAQRALLELESGANLDEVEVPVVTTWDQWAKTSGSAIASVVEASFEARLKHRDVESTAVNTRVRDALSTMPRLLLVIDSIDEAAQLPAEKANLLHTITPGSGHHHRVVITSRPAAWKEISEWLPPEVVRVAELQPLDPEDITGFIEAWFENDPARASGLKTQLEQRSHLARAAQIPLVLTFYCRIAEDGDGIEPLPLLRHKLYSKVTRNTFERVRRTKKTLHTGKGVADRLRILADWAWQIGMTGTPAGLGGWGQTFTLDDDTDDAALDAIAPRVLIADDGTVVRRFQHRTFLEHFVAEYVASLSTAKAFEILFPHLWYDPDWGVSAPAAIAAHNRLHPGELLDRVIAAVEVFEADPSEHWVPASLELARTLILVMAESEPEEWAPSHQAILQNNRVSLVAKFPDLCARVSHWRGSNLRTFAELVKALPDARMAVVHALPDIVPQLVKSDEARAVVLSTLPDAGPFAVHRLAEILPQLVQSDEARAEARAGVLAALSNAGPHGMGDLVDVFLQLEATDEDRAEARGVVLAALPNADLHFLHVLVHTLLRLGATDEDRAEARSVVLCAVPNSNPYFNFARNLSNLLSQLVASDEERVEARAEMRGRLHNADLSLVSDLVGALLRLGATDDERAEARTVVLRILSSVDVSVVSGLVEVLLQLGATSEDRAEARAVVLAALLNADSIVVSGLTDVLPRLMESDQDRTDARGVVFAAITNADWLAVPTLADVVPQLVESDQDRSEALAHVLAALPGVQDLTYCALISIVPQLVGSPEDRAQALLAVLPRVGDFDPLSLYDLADVLLGLVESDLDRAQARAGVLASLLSAEPFAARRLADFVPQLVESDEDRTEARAGVLAALPNADPYVVNDLAGVLLHLGATDQDRAEARAIVLATLSNNQWPDPHAQRSALYALSDVLLRLGATDQDRAVARAVVLAALPNADPSTVGYRVELLSQLIESGADRAEARAGVLAILPNAHLYDVADLVELLQRLGANDGDRAVALEGVLTALRSGNRFELRDLAGVLPQLVTSDEDRAEARAVVLATAVPSSPGELAGVLVGLVESDHDRADARVSTLAAIPSADHAVVRDLAELLPQLVKSDEDRADLRHQITSSIDFANSLPIFSPVLRAVLSFEQWRTLMLRVG